jgi:hypothetical protein
MTSNASIPMAHREYEKILRQLKSGAKTPLANNNDVYNFLKK